MTDPTECQIRPATDDDLKRLRPVFPSLASKRAAAQTFVAVSDRDGEGAEQILGCAILRLLPGGGFVERGIFNVVVGLEHRRRGIGTRLLDQVLQTAREAGASTLTLGQEVAIDSGEAEFLSNNGLRVLSAMTTYESSLPVLVSIMDPVYERLLARGKVPASGRVVSLAESPKDRVCDVVMRNLGSSSPVIAQRIQSGVNSYSQQISRVAIMDDQVLGAILTTFRNAIAVVDVNVVEPTWRNTWVGVALKYHLFTELQDRGTSRLRFVTNVEVHPDTAKMARRSDAKTMATMAHYMMDL